ncbi:prolactin-3D4-like isoform X1 [Acomys russatus]|uniref:prolactin-3D4-like isoform X1 n=1 Tax=Acomys russatus TaxID=60746 RepID=UPI0021E32393|nr:prolactin-3D4-like isoform X1 [Acomys russatus]
MHMSLTLPGSAGMYLLLLMSNLLLWEHVASRPSTSVSTEDLYHRVVEQSHNTYIMAADIYSEFDLNFAKRSWLTDRMPTVCHTASIHTPENREEVHETKTEDLLVSIANITRAWIRPLKYLASEVAALPGASATMLKTANDLKERNADLLVGLKTILGRIKPGFAVNGSPTWSGLKDLKSSDEDTRLFAFYNNLRCLKRDMNKVDSFLKVLRCRVVFNNEC